MSAPTTESPSHRRWLRWTLGIGLLPACIVAFYLIENYRGEKAWAAAKTKLEAEGISLSFESYLPPKLDIPEDQNVAQAEFYRSLDATPPAGIPEFEPTLRNFRRFHAGDFASAEAPNFDNGGGQISTGLPPLADDRRVAAQQVMDALAVHDPVFGQIRAACARPHVQFEHHWTGEDLLGPPYRAATDTANVLKLRGTALLILGRSGEALNDLKLVLRQADLMHSPDSLSFVVQQGILSNSIILVWQGLAGNHWTDAELRELVDIYRNLNLTPAWETQMWSNHASLQARVNGYVQDRGEANPEIATLLALDGAGNPLHLPDKWNQSRIQMTAALIPNGWLRQVQARCASEAASFALELKTIGSRHDILPVTPRSSHHSSGWTSMRSHRGLFSYLTVTLLSHQTSFMDSHRRLMAWVAFARTAIALEQYRRATGSLPNTLATLSPPPPVDPITGQPLHYELLPDGKRFRLWSVAINGTDEGGINERNIVSSPDWVWRSWMNPPKPPAPPRPSKKGVPKRKSVPPPTTSPP